MIRGTLFLLVAALALLGQQRGIAKELYVAPQAGAMADGSVERPYGSLPDAVAAVRELRANGYSEPVKIILREGRHQLNETLVLGLGDGAPARSQELALPKYGAGEWIDAPFLSFTAYPGEAPVVSAGVPVEDWERLKSAPPSLPRKARGKVWVADMPAGIERFHTLFDAKGRLSRARDKGFYPSKTGDRTTLYFPKGHLKDWDNLEDVEIQVRPYRPWVINMLPLRSVDEERGIARTAVSATYEMGNLPEWVHDPFGATVWVENVLESLDEPGEWVVNTKTRKIYLWPSDPAADGSPRGILAPSTSELVRVEGAIDYEGPLDEAVRGIAFEGLTFTHGDRLAWTSDEARLGWGLQHDWDLFDSPSAMLRFRGAEECQVIDCDFLDSGGTGVRLDLHAQRNRIENCEFAHLGEAGIIMAGYGPGTKDANHHNEVVNNYIHHFSEITWHSPGIWAWQSGHNYMAHNHVSHSGYAAVLITNRVEPDRRLDGEGGRTVRRHEIPAEVVESTEETYESWKARETYNHSRHNLFEYNEITHSVQKLSDGNGIYVSGAGTGNIVRYNFLHDNLEHTLPAAIRCDDDQHETTIHGNVLYNNYGFSAGIASKGVNDITNNFIVAPRTSPKSGYISYEWVSVKGSKVFNNIIVSHPDGGKAHGERPKGRGEPYDGLPNLEETQMDSNLYFHPSDSGWMEEHLRRLQAVGLETKSVFGDPLFVDPEGRDFRFRPGSPAVALGIEPLDVSKMGRIKEPSLRISDGTEFVPQDHYPKFSWDSTPMYYMFGDSNRLLSPEEVAFIAERTDFLTIEKSHGLKPLGAAELGAKHEAAAFKEAKPGIKALFYFNAAWAWPFTSYSKNITPERIDAHPELKKFLVVNPETGKLHHRRNVYGFDVLNPEFRKWWVDTVAKGVEASGCDGAFIDQMHAFFFLREDRKEEVHIAQGELISELKKRLGPEKIVLGNNTTDEIARYAYPAIDANMFEHYSEELLSKEKLLKDWDDMLRLAKDGKMSIFRIGVENDPHVEGKESLSGEAQSREQAMAALAKDRIEYHLACFLIGAQPYSYFQYGWGWTLNSGSLHDFPMLRKRLGPPKGAYTRVAPDAWEFTREFEYASVWVDTEKGEAKITWR
ncbi:putative glycoside hydrolase [Pelagicoccus sp. SDUM812005]|uniref:putative glycoside hydrolase n=1 Tax=Pelagicoccus sp. SDUM812005 TaxID=3041257 RepID=UPI0028103F27|nr:putative glycoside hydrolase [Pelagicoccus sp. SDUM812005]MDQ8183561.1 putative glycoside hydrolase [Pelagicoccus sp. SDUM812005]